MKKTVLFGIVMCIISFVLMNVMLWFSQKSVSGKELAAISTLSLLLGLSYACMNFFENGLNK